MMIVVNDTVDNDGDGCRSVICVGSPRVGDGSSALIAPRWHFGSIPRKPTFGEPLEFVGVDQQQTSQRVGPSISSAPKPPPFTLFEARRINF